MQVNTLRYELENIKQERDVTALRHEKELRDLQSKADADFRKAQVCGTGLRKAFMKKKKKSNNSLLKYRLPNHQVIAPTTKAKLLQRSSKTSKGTASTRKPVSSGR